MSAPAIRVENLSKRYVISHTSGSRDGLRNSLETAFRNPLSWLKSRRAAQRQPKDEFWALRDVSFDVAQGEVVGIIGRNGAGKSTLLKLLSRITEPTSGRISIEGRVASLLEVGTGFHPELTGRENIFLNGAILGMSRNEITRKFDEIVDFAEVERFLDTPVKRYSSGMYVRLAFAVAAHLEPEILIVDEVLAVGDAQFQKKCLGKMNQVAKEGDRTVLFVSHQMAAITNLCENCVLLSHGEISYHGRTDEAVTRYLASPASNKNLGLASFRASWSKPYIASARLLTAEGTPQSAFPLGSGLIIEITFAASGNPPLRRPVMGIVIKHSVIGTAAGVNMRMTGSVGSLNKDHGTIRCHLSALPLLQGTYTIELWLGDGPSDLDMIDGYLTFTIEDADIYKSGQLPFANMGLIYLRPTWEVT